ncbi:unnamed protein product, partial [Ascophyllum nodosum]
GAIPAEFYQLTALSHLNLSGNQLTDFGNAKHALGLAGEFNFYGGLFF